MLLIHNWIIAYSNSVTILTKYFSDILKKIKTPIYSLIIRTKVKVSYKLKFGMHIRL